MGGRLTYVPGFSQPVTNSVGHFNGVPQGRDIVHSDDVGASGNRDGDGGRGSFFSMGDVLSRQGSQEALAAGAYQEGVTEQHKGVQVSKQGKVVWHILAEPNARIDDDLALLDPRFDA